MLRSSLSSLLALGDFYRVSNSSTLIRERYVAVFCPLVDQFRMDFPDWARFSVVGTCLKVTCSQMLFLASHPFQQSARMKRFRFRFAGKVLRRLYTSFNELIIVLVLVVDTWTADRPSLDTLISGPYRSSPHQCPCFPRNK